MSQPPAYNRSFSFGNFQAQNPTGVLPGNSIDLELNNVKSSIDGIESNLLRIQRDDGALANGSVTYDTLSPSLQTAGIAPALPWVTGTAYTVGASVTHGSAFYRCLVAHTSSVFATDLAAGDWVLIVDFATIALVAASMIAVAPSGSLTSNAQTSLQALDTGKAPLSHTHLSTAISDSTVPGRALLTAPDVATQNLLLGTSTLGFQSGDIKETACPVLQSGWYYCDGSNKSRVTDAALFNAITIQQSGVLVNENKAVTGLSDTSNLSPGMPISGIGVSVGNVIQSVDSSTQITMFFAATVSATLTLVFAPYGVGDGSTTFGLPNRARIGVGRDNASGSASNLMQVSTTITTTAASATATVASSTGLFVGMNVNTPTVPIGTSISAIVGNTLTLNGPASANASGAAARFSVTLDAQTLGSVGGAISQNNTLVVGNLPPITSFNNAAPITVTTTQKVLNGPNVGSATAGGSALTCADPGSGAQVSLLNSTGNNSITLTSVNTNSTPFRTQTVQPTIVMNYIIKR